MNISDKKRKELKVLKLEREALDEKIKSLQGNIKNSMPEKEYRDLVNRMAQCIVGYLVDGACVDGLRIKFKMFWEGDRFVNIDDVSLSTKGLRSKEAIALCNVLNNGFCMDEFELLEGHAFRSYEASEFTSMIEDINKEINCVEEEFGIYNDDILTEAYEAAEQGLKPKKWV